MNTTVMFHGGTYVPCILSVRGPSAPNSRFAVGYDSCAWGGARGVALKSNSPKRYVYAEIFGLHLEPLSIFKVIMACSRSLSHRDSGKFGSTNAKPILKCCLNVCIARSARLVLCAWGGD